MSSLSCLNIVLIILLNSLPGSSSKSFSLGAISVKLVLSRNNMLFWYFLFAFASMLTLEHLELGCMLRFSFSFLFLKTFLLSMQAFTMFIRVLTHRIAISLYFMELRCRIRNSLLSLALSVRYSSVMVQASCMGL